ncbi:MAG: polysaccharide lyase beta-sandwich domain-containing protein [Firmicutes bacterium]|nr:polysaccharide lyase beta-sandwich domain-containing protein [Bacillota bacterium]
MNKSFMKLAVITLVLSLGLQSTAFAANIWDGYVEMEDAQTREILINMNHIETITAVSGLSPSASISGEANYSAHWNEHPNFTSISFTLPGDCSAVNKLIIPIYSAEATNARIFVIFRCENVTPLASGTAYFDINFTIDWVGWKTFEWVLGDENTHVSNSPDLSNAQRLVFAAGWDNSTPHPRSDLYIDSITFEREDLSVEKTQFSNVLAVELAAFEAVMNGSVAVYNYNRNVYTNGSSVLMDAANPKATVLTKGGAAMVPAEFFKQYLGISFTENEEGIFLGEKVFFRSGKAEYTIDGDEKIFLSPPFEKDGLTFVSLVECSAALGLAVKSFGELTVVGSESSIDALTKDRKKVEIAIGLTTQNLFDANNITKEDYDAVKAAFRYNLVGDEESNDRSNPHIASKLDSRQRLAISTWNSMNRGDDIPILFGNSPALVTDDMTRQYRNLREMAYGYGSFGTSTYKDPQLKKSILFGLEWMYENLYGEAEITNTGWRDTTLFNWWDWYIGAGTSLMHVLLIMEPEMFQSDIDKYMSPFIYFWNTRYMQKDQATGRILVETMAAILTENVDMWDRIYEDYEYPLRFQWGNGVAEDFSYIAHNRYPLAGMYGIEVLFNRLVNTFANLAGTNFEMSTPNKYRLAQYMYNTFEPLYFNGAMTTRVLGRVPDEGVMKTRELVQGAVRLLGVFGPDDDARLKSIIRKNVDQMNLNSVIGGGMPFSVASKIIEIVEDDSIPVINSELSRVYYLGEMVVHHRKDFGASLVMSSNTIGNYESINGENKTGWYQGDGVLYIYRPGNKNEFQYGSAFWNNVNPYRLPGITADSQERKVWSIRSGYMPNPNFVGGVELEGRYAIGVMDFEGYHHDVHETGTDNDAGGQLPYFDNDLVAKKSWFMLDNEIVALGSGITSTKNSPVYTVVENKMLKKVLDPTGKNVSMNEYDIISVTAAGDDGNIPENVLDGNLLTRWSLQGTEDSWLILEFDEVKPIGLIGVAQYNGTEGRMATFDLDVSDDGLNWVTVFSGNSSGTTNDIEYYNAGDVNARFVRYNGHGRTYSDWNSVTEIKIYPPGAETYLTQSANEESNIIYGAEDIIVNGELLEKHKSIEKSYENPVWVHIEGAGGYYFPKGGYLSLNKTGNSTSFAELWLNHNANPQDETYAYVLLPSATADETEMYSLNPDIEVLSNTSQIQAVRNTKSGITGIVFWEAGTFGDITASVPLAIMIRETDNEYVISMSDPGQQSSKVTVTIDGCLNVISTDPNVAVKKGEKTEISLQMCANPGKSLAARFKKQ